MDVSGLRTPPAREGVGMRSADSSVFPLVDMGAEPARNVSRKYPPSGCAISPSASTYCCALMPLPAVVPAPVLKQLAAAAAAEKDAAAAAAASRVGVGTARRRRTEESISSLHELRKARAASPESQIAPTRRQNGGNTRTGLRQETGCQGG